MLIPENSPLRTLPGDLSRQQVLVLDGVRYAAEMADVAYSRLFDQLQSITEQEGEPSTRHIASVMLDAWSIVDSVHRFRNLVDITPGLANLPWKRLLRDRTTDVAELRNCVQHQRREVDALAIDGGQIWGWLSWAEVRNRNHTGRWLMMSPGSIFRGDTFVFVGPVVPAIPLPPGRIRLNAFGREVYLGKSIAAVRDAIQALTDELANGNVRLRGQPTTDRVGADEVWGGLIEVAYKRQV